MNLFQNLKPNVTTNSTLREPQIKAYEAIASHNFSVDGSREVGIVLPVGCGKSGLLAIAPFAVKSRRTLLVAPNINIAKQLLRDLNPSDAKYFYLLRHVLAEAPFPETAELRGTSSNVGDLEDADIVVTNIQQLQGGQNKWLAKLPNNFFDLIEFDEGHHNVAESWELLRTKFPMARILNVSATPSRADGRLMSGKIIYSYPISEAVKRGFVKRVNGHRLNPTTLHYVRREGAGEIEVGLEEVRRLGEQDASFRRSIVSSNATLSTIAEASIRKLRELRDLSGEERLKIIASALNMEHCKQVVAKYQELGMRTDFVHSDLGKANDRVYQKLENHELDVIVQVKKLGEGFDHPYLTVAAVFSIFSNLAPFMQFVGRIMRVIPGKDPFDSINEGVVVFHVGGNITGVWNDFQEFAEADQEFFANLIDEELVVGNDSNLNQEPSNSAPAPLPVVTSQDGILLENIALLSANPDVAQALKVLRDAGVQSGEQFDELARIVPSKQAVRKSKRKLLDERVKTQVGRLLANHNIPHAGHELDKSRLGYDNFRVLKSAIDGELRQATPSAAKKRSDFTMADLDYLLENLPMFVQKVESELLHG